MFARPPATVGDRMFFSDRAFEVYRAVPYFLEGVGVTLSVTFLALFLGGFIGLAAALCRVYGPWPVRGSAAFYSRTIRSLPLLVILFFLYFLGSDFFDLSVYISMVLALSIHSSAYQEGIFRAGIQSIERGQSEAARALGMTGPQGVLTVVLPQALRRALPYWSNEAAIVLKDSSLAYVLGLAELMRRGQYVVARTHQALLTYLIIGLIYFLLTLLFTRTLSLVEKRVRIPN